MPVTRRIKLSQKNLHVTQNPTDLSNSAWNQSDFIIFYNFFYDFVFYDFGCYINIIWRTILITSLFIYEHR